MTKYERAALRDVNRIRRAEGRKPLKRLPAGKVEDAYNCPIARALDSGKIAVGNDNALVIPISKLVAYMAAGLKLADNEPVAMRMPRSFDRFVRWFDSQETDEARALNVRRPK